MKEETHLHPLLENLQNHNDSFLQPVNSFIQASGFHTQPVKLRLSILKLLLFTNRRILATAASRIEWVTVTGVWPFLRSHHNEDKNSQRLNIFNAQVIAEKPKGRQLIFYSLVLSKINFN